MEQEGRISSEGRWGKAQKQLLAMQKAQDRHSGKQLKAKNHGESGGMHGHSSGNRDEQGNNAARGTQVLEYMLTRVMLHGIHKGTCGSVSRRFASSARGYGL